MIVVDVEDDPDGRPGEQKIVFRAVAAVEPPPMELAEAGPAE
jgi:hypothetical protein